VVIIFAPGFAFRGVDVTVHPREAEEPQRLQAIPVRPGRAPKRFGEAAPGERRRFADLKILRETPVSAEHLQFAQGVKGALIRRRGDRYAARLPLSRVRDRVRLLRSLSVRPLAGDLELSVSALATP